jgi:hypothetical protein
VERAYIWIVRVAVGRFPGKPKQKEYPMFQYRKFDNQWMIAGADDLAPGAKVTVTTKAGKDKVETVAALVATLENGRKVYAIEQKAKAIVEAPKAAGPDYGPLLEAVKKIVDGAAGKELAANFPHSFAALMDGINKAGMINRKPKEK